MLLTDGAVALLHTPETKSREFLLSRGSLPSPFLPACPSHYTRGGRQEGNIYRGGGECFLDRKHRNVAIEIGRGASFSFDNASNYDAGFSNEERERES